MDSIELFAGAGGLALGTDRAGFQPQALIEWNQGACDTLQTNLSGWGKRASNCEVFRGDVREFDFKQFQDRLDLLSGGPPCQPFSIGGKHRGHHDARDMFPEAARAVRLTRPRAFIFENVRGLLRRSFAKYFEYIVLQLKYPEIALKNGEDWSDHLARLERHHTSGRYRGLYYRVAFQLLNAADFGAPQKRERVVIVGFRSDIRETWSFPKPTHSEEELLRAKLVSGDYWEEHRIPKRSRPDRSLRVRQIELSLSETSRCSRWQTVRDAISGLPKFRRDGSSEFPNHRYQPGARAYPGHTGSPLDEPAKTLKAGDHGVPGGENMMVNPDGSVRYFSVRESSRLQTFPDWFVFPGSWTESMRQIGNAVPVRLAQAVAESVAEALVRHQRRMAATNHGFGKSVQPTK